MKPMISLCSSVSRPRYWKQFYDSLFSNSYGFEVVFVGIGEPEFDLPKNFKFFYSEVKPSQCWEAAIRLSEGKYISITADDAEYDIGAIDNMINYMESMDSKKFVGSFVTIENGEDVTEGHKFHDWKMAPFFVFRKDYYMELGGADSRFIGGQWENDLLMRVHEDGGIVGVCKNAKVIVDHKTKHIGGSKCSDQWRVGNDLFLSLWQDFAAPKRLDAVQKFSDSEILIKSQG